MAGSDKEVTLVICRNWLTFQGEGGSPIDVPSVGDVRSVSMPLVQDVSFGWLFQFASPGLVDVQIELEQANKRPTTEKTADAEFVVPDGVESLVTITDNVIHVVAFNPVVTRFARLILTGQGANDAGTQLVRAEMMYAR